MCGRYALTQPEQIYERFAVHQHSAAFAANTNIKPGDYAPVILREEGENRLSLMRWGFVPPWAKDLKLGYKMINARAETVAEKPSFKPALLKQRCLIPTTGFYEWQYSDKGKIPYLFTLTDTTPFAFAGLYSSWKSPAGETLDTYTIITTGSNTLVGRVHDRMPVILDKDHEAIWLDQTVTDPLFLTSLLDSYSPERMEMQPVAGKL